MCVWVGKACEQAVHVEWYVYDTVHVCGLHYSIMYLDITGSKPLCSVCRITVKLSMKGLLQDKDI